MMNLIPGALSQTFSYESPPPYKGDDLVRNVHGFYDGLFEVYRFDTKIIFLRQISYLIDTIMARGQDDLSARFLDLFRLELRISTADPDNRMLP